MGGFFVGSIGWRWGYYIGAILTFAIFVVSYFAIPKDAEAEHQTISKVFERMRKEIDWVGCFVLSTSLGLSQSFFSHYLSGTSNDRND